MIDNPLTPNDMLHNEDILNFGPIGNWFPSEDRMSGTLEWHRKDNDSVTLYATPHWNEDGIVPVAVSYEDGEYNEIHSFELRLKESVDYQLNQYIAIISVILSKLK
jgi:hypothetical protein